MTDGRPLGADYDFRYLDKVFATLATLFGAPVSQLAMTQPVGPDSDADISRRLQTGQFREAFALLLPHYRDKVFRLCFSMLQQRAWAEDVSQDVFLRIWRALPGFAGQSSLSTWIYAISRNACLSELRKKRPHVSIDDDEDGYHPEISALAVADADDSATVSVGQMLDQLPERYRQAVTLFYMEDKSYEQTATSLGMPLGTVKALLHRARKRLVELAKDAA
jgi:RNA polymerase sigma-70 factor (ECF subfamily)